MIHDPGMPIISRTHNCQHKWVPEAGSAHRSNGAKEGYPREVMEILDLDIAHADVRKTAVPLSKPACRLSNVTDVQQRPYSAPIKYWILFNIAGIPCLSSPVSPLETAPYDGI